LALALSASGLPITAQRAPTDAQPTSAGTGDGFRSSPVMFVENAGQGDKRNASEIVDKNKAEHTPVSSESWNVELIGQVGGPTYAVAVQGNYAYIGVGPRLVILDIADPAHPIPVGQTPVLPDVVKGITVVGNYAYVANASAGLRIVNIANPVAPIEVSFWDTPDIAERVAIAGQYAYVADSSSGLRIIDIRNPMAPVEVGAYDTPGTAIDVVVTNNHAYVADSSSGLRIISVANPSSPSEVGFYAESAVRLVINGNYVYLAAGSRGLRIISVANPAQPVEVGAMQSANPVHAVAMRDHLVYLLAGSSEVRIIDVMNVAAPIRVGSASVHTGNFYDLSLAGDYAFVAGGTSGHGLWIANISSPTSPAFISSHRTFHPGVALAVAEKRAYTVHEDIPPRFRMVDVSEPNGITAVGVCCEDTINFDVAAAGNYAYIASDFNGLRVIDASNPISPVAVGHYGNFYAKDVEVRGRYAYVWGIGFRVFDVSAPNAPKLIGVLSEVSGLPDDNRVAVTDDYYYATTSWSEGDQLEVINITNPRIPVQVASLRLPYTTKGIAISGNYLFIAAGDNGLRTMDVSNPRTPVEVASLQIPGGAKGVAISGSYLYIGAGANGLRVMDISSPLAPSEVGYYKALQRETTRLVVSEGLIYLPLRDLGLFVLRFGTTPTTYSISGRVTDANGRGIPGVTVWAGFPRNTTTDADGNYTFTGLPAGTYTIRPEKDPYVFSPESRTATVPPSATSVNFTGRVPIVHVKLLYVPLNWQNTQAAFDAEADLQSSIFFDQVPLSACPEKYRVEKLSVAAQNFTGFTCSGDAIGSIREFLQRQGINAEDYTAVIGLAETSPCPPTGGQSNGTNTVWVTAEYDIVTAHELGHIWGLSDQYCSTRDGMSTDGRCNDGDIQGDGAQTGDVNWLDSSLPCDCPPDWSEDSTGAQCCNFITTCDKPEGCYFKGVFIAGYNQSYLRRCDSENYGELGIVHVNYGVCCLGNKTAGGGRSIMSFASAPGPRAFDIHDLAHLNTRQELNCDVVTASQTTAGGLPSYIRQLILDVNLLVHRNDSVHDKGIRIIWGRPTSDSVLQGLDGNYAIAVFDASGAQVWSQAFPLYFDYTGPVVLGEDYSDIIYDLVDVAFRIPHSCGMSELRLYHSGRMIFSKTLPTVCPIYLPLVLRSN
jgi:hypothetical protein